MRQECPRAGQRMVSVDPDISPHPDDAQSATPNTSAEAWWLAELFCWTIVVLAPVLRWIHGPAVSTDQLVVRIALVSLALVGAVTLRTVAIVRAMKRRRCPPPSGLA